ncbi:hypothetical protein POM88_054680 [Heracleum sosnowskyi]|uniref:Uncharacterized protein n=1 Tax=Heracleum sosnowskyi TaxID=360622 RepID=A0AAD8LVY3_9APIA|nr:hypothetical protein POM88_054680 [Heracleum sosnowskyi]
MAIDEEGNQHLFKQLMCYYILEELLMCGKNAKAILFHRVPSLVPESWKNKNVNPHPPIQKYGPIRKDYEGWKNSLSGLRKVNPCPHCTLPTSRTPPGSSVPDQVIHDFENMHMTPPPKELNHLTPPVSLTIYFTWAEVEEKEPDQELELEEREPEREPDQELEPEEPKPELEPEPEPEREPFLRKSTRNRKAPAKLSDCASVEKRKGEFLLGGVDSKKLRCSLWSFVVDLKAFEKVNWAKPVKEHLMVAMEDLKKRLDGDTNKKKQHSFKGCAHVLEVKPCPHCTLPTRHPPPGSSASDQVVHDFENMHVTPTPVSLNHPTPHTPPVSFNIDFTWAAVEEEAKGEQGEKEPYHELGLASINPSIIDSIIPSVIEITFASTTNNGDADGEPSKQEQQDRGGSQGRGRRERAGSRARASRFKSLCHSLCQSLCN